MDTSLEYVMMCARATELQGQWKFVRGDYFSSIPQANLQKVRGEEMVSIVDDFWFDDELTKKIHPKTWVWLPRQDQLQDMIDASKHIVQFGTEQNVWGILFEFEQFVMHERYHNRRMYSTIEQLWIGYVMYENFCKRWDGTHWIRVEADG